METFDRRSVMATGMALATGGVLASAGVGGANETGDDDACACPPSTSGWWTAGGNAASTRAVSSDGEFEPPDTVAWQFDKRSNAAVAVDGMVYLTTDHDREVYALDAEDGSVVWKTENIGAKWSPTVGNEAVYVGGSEQLTAFDASTGDVRWQIGDELGESFYVQFLADDTLYVITDRPTSSLRTIDPVLYAIDTADGSVRWKRESVSVASSEGVEQEYYVQHVVAQNNTLYAAVLDEYMSLTGIAELDPTTGETKWATSQFIAWFGAERLAATEKRLYLADSSSIAVFNIDDRTTEEIQSIRGRPDTLAVSDGTMVTGGRILYGTVDHSSRSPDPAWRSDEYELRAPTIVDDTVVATNASGDGDDELIGYDLEDGSTKWRFELDTDRWSPFLRSTFGSQPVISGDTVYVNTSNGPTAFRPARDDEKDSGNGNDNDDGGGSSDDGSGDDGDGSGDNESDDGSSDDSTDDRSGDDGDDGDDSDDSGGSGDDEDENDDGADDDNGDDDSGTGTDVDDDTDETPGFTVGAGLTGGVLTLEWLRRRGSSEETAQE